MMRARLDPADYDISGHMRPPEPAVFNPDRPYLIAGTILSGIIYLVAAFLAGLALDNRLAWTAALAALGINYLTYAAQIAGYRPAATALNIVSIALGLGAGLALLLMR